MFNDQIVWLRGALHGDGPADVKAVREQLEAWDDPRLWRYASEALKRRRGSPALQKLQLLATLQLEETPPTLWVSSWFRKAPSGPGSTWSISRLRPKDYLDARGLILALTPTEQEQDLFVMSPDEARKRFDAAMSEQLEAGELSPGRLQGVLMGDPAPYPEWKHHLPENDYHKTHDGYAPVRSGDTLRGLGSKPEVQRDAHWRAWIIPWLRAAGWRIVLDGVEV